MNNILDQDNIKKKVLIGLSGGVSSFLAAYILKIQKFDLCAATIMQKINSETKCSVSPQDLLNIQDFCRRLNIAHYIIEADEAFAERVENAWVSKRIEVKPWSPLCVPCHQLRMDLLFDKMNEVKAEQLATGHFAKVFHSPEGSSVHSGHDPLIDQSHLLQNLPSSILSHLNLPLASLGSPEIEKLALNFSLPSREKGRDQCFTGPHSQEVLQRFSHFAFKVDGPGNVYKSELKDDNKNLFIAGKSLPSGELRSEDKTYFFRKKMRLLQVQWSVARIQGRPLLGYLNFADGSTHKVRVFPKTLHSVVIELEQELEFDEFTPLAIYKNKGGSSQLMLSGIIVFVDESPDQIEGFVF